MLSQTLSLPHSLFVIDYITASRERERRKNADKNALPTHVVCCIKKMFVNREKVSLFFSLIFHSLSHCLEIHIKVIMKCLRLETFYANIAMPFKHSSECARLINKLRSLIGAWFLRLLLLLRKLVVYKVTISKLFLTVIIHTHADHIVSAAHF